MILLWGTKPKYRSFVFFASMISFKGIKLEISFLLLYFLFFNDLVRGNQTQNIISLSFFSFLQQFRSRKSSLKYHFFIFFSSMISFEGTKPKISSFYLYTSMISFEGTKPEIMFLYLSFFQWFCLGKPSSKYHFFIFCLLQWFHSKELGLKYHFFIFFLFNDLIQRNQAQNIVSLSFFYFNDFVWGNQPWNIVSLSFFCFNDSV